MLLPPTDTPLTGIEFTRRLPCGETERARKVMYVLRDVQSVRQLSMICRLCGCSLPLDGCVRDYKDRRKRSFLSLTPATLPQREIS